MQLVHYNVNARNRFYLENNNGNVMWVTSGARSVLFASYFQNVQLRCIYLSYLNIIRGSILWKTNAFRQSLGIMFAPK